MSEASEYPYLASRTEHFLSGLRLYENRIPNPQMLKPVPLPIYRSREDVMPPRSCSSVDGLHEAAARLLFLSVKWARNVPAFLQLPFRDQIILLEESWRELFALYAIQWNLPLDINLLLSSLGSYTKAIEPDRMALMSLELRRFQELSSKFRSLNVSEEEFIFLKSITLFKPGRLKN